MKNLTLMILALAIAGCGNSTNGNHNNDMGMNGGDGGVTDMTPPNDLTDTTPIPAPTVKHVGMTGTTCCILTSEKSVAYLLNPSPTAGGELHVATSDGTDVTIAAGVGIGGYSLSPDGKALFFEGAATADGTLPLSYVDLTKATPTPTQLFTRGLPGPLGQISVFSPSGKYFLLGVLPPNVSVSPDLHVIDVSKGTDVYQRANGEFDYIEVVLPDDTMIFQDTVGGQGSPPTTPVQTLFWISLPTAGTTTAATINTKTSGITPSPDGKTLVYQRTNGDLYAWDLSTKTGMGTKIASGTTKYTVGSDSNGPVAYVGADNSIHVVGFDGTAKLDIAAATAGADQTGGTVLAPDNADVYYWQNVDTQDHRGTLMRAALTAGATPSKVGDKISMADLNVTDTALVFLQNVDDLGQFGDAARANRDGTGIAALGMKVPVGGLRVVNPGPATWFAMHLTNGAIDMTNVADRWHAVHHGRAGVGRLSSAAAESALDAKVHEGAFGFSDDGRDAVFVTGAAYNSGSSN